jgi:CheY-like chemotaxis protein
MADYRVALLRYAAHTLGFEQPSPLQRRLALEACAQLAGALAAAGWSETPSVRILIAEEDRAAQSGLARGAAAAGHEVVAVEDGQAALESLEQHSFPLVISDWMMPRLSGLELCRAVRAREAERLAEGKNTRLHVPDPADPRSTARPTTSRAWTRARTNLLTKPLDTGAAGGAAARGGAQS